MIYLDNAATTPVNPQVAQTISESLMNDFGNPSSLYSIGARSEMAIDKARESVAGCIGAKASELYFTSCASESNNIAIYGLALARKNWGKKIITTGYEHPAVRKPYELLQEMGFEMVEINPDKTGIVDENAIVDAVDSKTCLVTLIHVNNETGAKLDIEKLTARIKEKNPRTAIHIDAVQSFMKYPLDVKKLKIESLSFSAHKINGPKGIGGLYLRSGTNIKPVFVGGGQEKGLRAGTENIHYIKGVAKACELLKPNIMANLRHYAQLKARLLEGLEQFDNVVINSPENAAPYTVNLSFTGYRSETLLHFLDSKGICVSSGSACSKGSRSHTLTVMKLSNERIDSSLRVSFGVQNTESDVDALLAALKEAKEKLQKVKR
ncbi:MAG: cysteine desulfurase [Oscillospiraceae bacterium]|nr:cysteine desulfurase [Oscillospiraceae bacterium]